MHRNVIMQSQTYPYRYIGDSWLAFRSCRTVPVYWLLKQCTFSSDPGPRAAQFSQQMDQFSQQPPPGKMTGGLGGGATRVAVGQTETDLYSDTTAPPLCSHPLPSVRYPRSPPLQHARVTEVTNQMARLDIEDNQPCHHRLCYAAGIPIPYTIYIPCVILPGLMRY